MDLSSLNVDVLLHLMEFVEPVDRFNLAVSGILKGFENVNKGIDLRQRIDYCGAKLGLRRDSTCELEIRSMRIEGLPDKNLLKILKHLEEKGSLQNNQQLKHVSFESYQYSPFLEVQQVMICFMKNLEKLDLSYKLTLEDLTRVFQSCSKLVELDIATDGCKTHKMTVHEIIQLRSGFQRLRRLKLTIVPSTTFRGRGSMDFLQEMLTWLQECVHLTVFYKNGDNELAYCRDGSLTFDPNFAEGLKFLNISNVPAALAKWILSVCLNIQHLQIVTSILPNGLHNKIARLKKLKELDVLLEEASDVKEILKNCRQVEILRMDVYILDLEDLAELEPAENITDITLYWEMGRASLGLILAVLKRWRKLRRLTFTGLVETEIFPPPFEVLSNFIMGMEYLSYLHIALDCDDRRLNILHNKVNELIIPRRPNFKFDISCI